jgi:hypothetical protein
VTLSPTPAPGSTFVDGLVRLECNAGPGAITVALGTSQNGVARPASGSVTVAAGDSTVAFGVVTAPVAKAASAVISAAANTIVKTRRLAVTPAAPGQAINLVFVEGRQLKRVALDGTVVGTLPIEGPFAIGEDRAQILHVKGTTGFDNAVWLYDLATGDDTLIVAAPWASSLDWIPGSTSRFVYNRNGALYLHDLSAGTSSLWQDRDTALALFGQDDYRGVAFAAPGGVLTKVLTRIGHAGGGGDGVFLGTYCAGDARHHLCGLTAVSDPAGDSASWATIAAGPAISSDGDLAFFTQRIDWYTHRIVRKDLVSGEAHTLLEERTTSGDTGFGDLTLLEDRYLVFRGPCEGSDGPVRVCDAVTGACPTLAIATPGTSCGGPAVAVRW